MSTAYSALGVVMIALGIAVIAMGAWAIVTARKPPWTLSQRIPAGRERGWGAATVIFGVGLSLLGAANVLSADFTALKAGGIVLILGGVALLFFVVSPEQSR